MQKIPEIAELPEFSAAGTLVMHFLETNCKTVFKSSFYVFALITWFLKVAAFNHWKFTLGTLCNMWHVSELPGDKLQNSFKVFEIFVHSKHVSWWSCKMVRLLWYCLILLASWCDQDQAITLSNLYLCQISPPNFALKAQSSPKNDHHPHFTRRQSDQQPSTSERGQQRKHPSHPSSKGEVTTQCVKL